MNEPSAFENTESKLFLKKKNLFAFYLKARQADSETVRDLPPMVVLASDGPGPPATYPVWEMEAQ